jgi:hypothetical protein
VRVFTVALTVFVLLAVIFAGVFIAREMKRRGDAASSHSVAKLRGDIVELYFDSPYPPHGADYALVLKLRLTSFPPVSTGIKGFRLETVCAGKPHESTVLHDAAYWELIQDKTLVDSQGRSYAGSEQTVLTDFRKVIGEDAMPHDKEHTGWLAFLFSGMFGRASLFQPPEAFNAYRTQLVLTDWAGRQHRFTVHPDFANSGVLGQSP